MLSAAVGLGRPRAWIRLSLCAAGIALVVPQAAQAAKPAFLKGHPYRHGAVPFHNHSKLGAASQVAAASANNLTYGGSNTGAGVQTGAERVYLVLWGSQWGTQGANGSGYATFSGDSAGVAPDLQAFFTGLGTGGETWSGVMTQYCNGVATGHRPARPRTPSTSGIPQAARSPECGRTPRLRRRQPPAATRSAPRRSGRATHFGNTTQASNANAQYVIVSPHGTNPDSYESGGFCAWHDYTADSTLDGGGAVSSPTAPSHSPTCRTSRTPEPRAGRDSSTTQARSTA